MEIQVKKRDGSIEPWSFDKLVASIGKAGVPVREAEVIAAKVQSWAEQNSQNGQISSTQIRDKVIEVLSENYPVEAENYKTYKK